MARLCMSAPFTMRGETRTVAEWCDVMGINRSTLRSRVYDYGWSLEEALSEPSPRATQRPCGTADAESVGLARALCDASSALAKRIGNTPGMEPYALMAEGIDMLADSLYGEMCDSLGRENGQAKEDERI